MDLSEVIESTNTCRFYQKKAVADEDIATTLDAARFGPSGGNRQPVSFVVVKDNETKKRCKRSTYYSGKPIFRRLTKVWCDSVLKIKE